MSAPTRIFVSYSHEDRRWLNELKLVLTPLIRDERIALWDDREISAGMQWRPEIETQLRTANVGVLLVSANFFASRFISDVELPAILKRAEQNTLRLLWIAVSPSLVSETPLNKFQAVNDPKRPIDMLEKPQRMKAWVEIAEAIKDASGISAIAGALGAIDDSYNLVRSVVLGPETPAAQHPVAQYSAQSDTVAFTAHELSVTITAADMDQLDKESLALIQMYEDSMQQRFDRIRKLYPSRILPNGDIDTTVELQLRNLARPMCEDLNNILNFLAGMGKYLDDHYHSYRQLCSQLGS
jgi:hypothetical protein